MRKGRIGRAAPAPSPVQMNLLLDDVDVLETTGDLASADVRGVEHDSRRVVAGDLFCCLPGAGTDGHDHARDALLRGAVGLVCEHRVPDSEVCGASGGAAVPQAIVGPGGARPAMARIAAAFWGYPSRHMLMAGITGTNGKTTVAHLLAAVLEHAGHPTTVIGTLTGTRTTPEATDLQRLLAEVRDRASFERSGAGTAAGTPERSSAGTPERSSASDQGHGSHGPAHPGVRRTDAAQQLQPAVAMEVSSHALVQSRVDAVHFDVAVFTNLSHEHLDFHGTMDAYFDAKAALFTPERAVRGVVNADDPWGRRLLADPRIPLVAVRSDAASHVLLEAGRSHFSWRTQQVEVAMTGAIGVQNSVMAAEAAVALGVEPPVVAAGLGAAAPVPGRLEAVAVPGRGGPPFTVLVDFAHTPAGLEAALVEARRLVAPAGRVLVVFGCGGERDPDKRPLMGAVAARMADVVVVTSDNPRHEDPEAIIEAILAGVNLAVPGAGGGIELLRDTDRRSAIDQVVEKARPRDVVVVAGKGHETTQDLGGRVVPFNDRDVVLEALSARWPGDPRSWAPSPVVGV
ncbi:MAG: Mur ligase family protein [Acidimicrobiales bacterium]